MGRANLGVPIMYNQQIITIQSLEIMTGCGLSLYSPNHKLDLAQRYDDLTWYI